MGLRGQLFEQPLLGREIGLHRLMVVEMILAEVGENGCVKLDIPHPVLHEGVAGGLHDGRTAIDVAHLPEKTLHIIRFRRGTRGGQLAGADRITHRADQPARALGDVEQVLEEKRNRGLAIGPGDPGSLQLERRMSVEDGRRGRKGGARILDTDHGGPRGIEFRRSYDGRRPFLHRFEDEVRAAARGLAGAAWRHAGQSNKETARGDLPGIVGEGGDFAVGRTFHRNRSGGEGRNDFGQLHATSVHAFAEGH